MTVEAQIHRAAEEIAEGVHRLYAELLNDKDAAIAELRESLQLAEREGELLRARIDELTVGVGREAA